MIINSYIINEKQLIVEYIFKLSYKDKFKRNNKYIK